SGNGDAPCICGDLDAQVFYVAYKTTTAHTIKILRVDTGANILTTTSFTYGVGTILGLWCTNTNASTNRLVVAAVDSATSGCFTTVRNATTLATIAIDNNTTTDTPTGPVVVGACQSGKCWIAYRHTNGLDIFTRSVSGIGSAFVT